MTVFILVSHLTQFTASALNSFQSDLKIQYGRHEAQSCKLRRFPKHIWILTKEKLFLRVTSSRKDKCFLLANYIVAFVKEVIHKNTFACEVIKTKHLEDVYESPFKTC